MAIPPSKDQPADPGRGTGLSTLHKWPVIESALGSWSKTAQLCVILIVLGISSAISYGVALFLWFVVR